MNRKDLTKELFYHFGGGRRGRAGTAQCSHEYGEPIELVVHEV